MVKRLLLLAGLTLLWGCDGGTSRSGRILDQDFNPVGEAKILLRFNEKTKTTSSSDPDGRYDVHLTHAPGRYLLDLTVTKNGYVEFQNQIRSNTRDDEFDIILKAAPKALDH